MMLFDKDEENLETEFDQMPEESSLSKFMKEQDEAQGKKNALNAVGSVLQGFANVPTGYEMIYGKKLNRGNPQEALSKAADMIENPSERKKKAYEYLKMKNEGIKMNEDTALLKTKKDPNSVQSKAAKALAQKYGIPVTPEMTAFDVEQMMDPKKMRETEAQSQITFGNQKLLKEMELGTRQEENALRRQERQDARDMKEAEKLDKKKQQMHEIEDRRQNINSSLTLLNRMIEEDGTYEMFGSHNQDIDRLIEAIATDMAKLQDPQSVARPAEVDAVKRNLIQSGFQNKNSTAQNLLKNFRNEVATRADSAYKVRGLEIPSNPTGETKTVNSPKDQQAVQWALQNPGDPRSAEILMRNNIDPETMVGER